MSMGIAPEPVIGDQPVSGSFGLLWVLKRAVLGIVILVVSIGSLAWLTHAAIDPTLEETGGLLPAIGRAAGNF